jgi:hypothetical protein
MRMIDLGFVWQIDSIQYHSFKSLAYLLMHPDENIRRTGRRVLLLSPSKMTEDELMLTEMPAIRISRLWLKKVRKEDRDGVGYGQMNYNTYRRIRRRWHTELFGYEKAKQFESARIKRDGTEGEYFKAYHPLPHCPASQLDLSKIGLPLHRLFDIMAGVEVEVDMDDEEDDE